MMVVGEDMEPLKNMNSNCSNYDFGIVKDKYPIGDDAAECNRRTSQGFVDIF